MLSLPKTVSRRLRSAGSEQVGIILLGIMYRTLHSFEVCERLKVNPQIPHVPVVMVMALDQHSDHVRGLKAGTDYFLTKPVNDLQLIARVKSFVCLSTVSDELRILVETVRQIGIDRMMLGEGVMQAPGCVLVIDGQFA